MHLPTRSFSRAFADTPLPTFLRRHSSLPSHSPASKCLAIALTRPAYAAELSSVLVQDVEHQVSKKCCRDHPFGRFRERTLVENSQRVHLSHTYVPALLALCQDPRSSVLVSLVYAVSYCCNARMRRLVGRPSSSVGDQVRFFVPIETSGRTFPTFPPVRIIETPRSPRRIAIDRCSSGVLLAQAAQDPQHTNPRGSEVVLGEHPTRAEAGQASISGELSCFYLLSARAFLLRQHFLIRPGRPPPPSPSCSIILRDGPTRPRAVSYPSTARSSHRSSPTHQCRSRARVPRPPRSSPAAISRPPVPSPTPLFAHPKSALLTFRARGPGSLHLGSSPTPPPHMRAPLTPRLTPPVRGTPRSRAPSSCTPSPRFTHPAYPTRPHTSRFCACAQLALPRLHPRQRPFPYMHALPAHACRTRLSPSSSFSPSLRARAHPPFFVDSDSLAGVRACRALTAGKGRIQRRRNVS